MNGRERQAAIYLGRLFGRLPRVPADPARLEAAACRKLGADAVAYLAGGAGSEASMAANRAAFDRWRIVPRVLRDVSARDLSVELFGRRLAAPVLLAPVGAIELAHPDADVAVARAAASLGVPYVFSNQASRPMEACAAAMGNAPRWFQLYWGSSDELAQSMIRRAEACGCEAIALTVDTKNLGWRTRDLDLGYLPFVEGKGLAQYFSDPVFLASLDQPIEQPAGAPSGRPSLFALRAMWNAASRLPGGALSNLASGRAKQAVRRFLADFPRPALAWADLPRLKAMTRLPLVLKGIQHPDDARRALDAGVDGIVVSNHGGRQLDGAAGALEALPAVAQAVAGRVPVLFDSGVRTGSDIVKAIGLGARAVLIGRPYAWGLALAGEAGVRDVVENLIAELDITMMLAGCASLAETAERLVPGRDER